MTTNESLSPGSYRLSTNCIRDLSIFKFVSSAERVMFETLRNEEITERLVGQWTATGVIGALFGSMAYAALTAPPPCDDPTVSDCLELTLYGVFMTSAATMELMSAIACTLLYMALNSCPQACGRAFLDYFLLLLPLPTMAMLGGVVALVLGTMIIIKQSFSEDLFDVFVYLLAVGSLILLYLLYFVIHGSKLVARRQYVVQEASSGDVNNPASAGGGAGH